MTREEVLDLIDKEGNARIYLYKQVPCAIHRSVRSGHLCGYIGIPIGHEWFGRGYDDLDVRVHGGLTYADSELSCFKTAGSDAWWIGFDCAHHGDKSPFRSYEWESDYPGTYKTMEYVEEELKEMVHQLHDATREKLKRELELVPKNK